MSRILPIKKSLDDRFINETDVITEQALAQVIEGQGDTGGGSASYVVSNRGFGLYTTGQVFSTKAEACVAAGISESDWDALISGELIADLVIDDGDGKGKFPYYAYYNDVEGKTVKWNSWRVDLTTSEKLYFIIAEENGGYFVAGINQNR